MEKSSPRFHPDHRNYAQSPQSLLPSPNSSSSSNSRSESANPYPTTFVQADTSSFKQVVQMLTGSPKSAAAAAAPPQQPDHQIPPIKSIPKRNQSSSGFKLYERRNSLKNLRINPLNPFLPEILSPSILDFPALVLSPVTPLIPDPFDRSNGGANNPAGAGMMEADSEEKAIKEKGFYLHPSPATTPREAEPPRLLPLFPVTSPRVSSSTGSATPSS
ncbi:unnamed protein product [Linum tenue]|uniref:VQ domain-containing protein n=1 Tax=Linum tenue TaxID=586396 RepID=A0AAV0JDR4_9ROSI|nr:unnamed protein product [Linum tenue]